MPTSNVSVSIKVNPTLSVTTNKKPDDHTVREWKEALINPVRDYLAALSKGSDADILKLINEYKIQR
jgi:hypothetical protein